MPRAITQEEKDNFRALTSGEYTNFGLVNTTLNGVETAVIVAINEETGDGEIRMDPLAILINEQIFEMLTDPTPLENS